VNKKDVDFDDVQVVTPGDLAQDAKNLDVMVSDVKQFDGAGLQKISTTYTTAMAVTKPRLLSEVKKRVLQEVELDPKAMYYSWLVTSKGGSKSKVQGGSIGLAMSIARNYGNCAVPVQAEELPTHYLFKAAFIDLETGFTVERIFRQRKKQDIGGKYDSDRKDDMTFQIGQSKAERNVIMKGVPIGIINAAVERAMEMVGKNYTREKIEESRKRMIEYFETRKITVEMLGIYLDEPDTERWTVDMMVSLSSVQSCMDTEGYHPSYFFPDFDTPEKKTAESKTSQKRSTNRKGETKQKKKEDTNTGNTNDGSGGGETAGSTPPESDDSFGKDLRAEGKDTGKAAADQDEIPF